MPIYEYKCRDCDHHLETLQKISDDPLKKCPACGADRLRRLISLTAFRLEGTGWYETDFKDKKPRRDKRADESDSGDKKSTDSGDKKSTDSTDQKSAGEKDGTNS